MIDRKALLSDLQAQVKAAETDLEGQAKREDAVRERLRAEYEASKKVGRTAATWQSWLDERITQVAVAWVLGTVFVRFVEDNGLVPEPYITAPDIAGREVAQARYDEYVDKAEDPTYRGWFERAFAELAEGPAGALLFSPHNPLRQIPLSHEGAGALRDFWQRTRDDEAGASVLVHDFTDPLRDEGDGTEGWDTRFLGDLYQDLSEAARKNYALLQTPEFVEEFILDRTMNPVVRERGGVEGLKMIDPTCGSGHFVLGAFRRLVREWAARRPELDAHARVRGALESVHGVDINPFAVAIARFRLLIAAMAAAGVRSLGEAAGYDWPVQLAVGDSLMPTEREEKGLFKVGDVEPAYQKWSYATEDIWDHPEYLYRGRYDVVVGNPPYITVKDSAMAKLYKELYKSCAMQYALSVPFAERFFELAKKGDLKTGLGFGQVGQITANSFMKREFGTKLIESFFRDRVELTEVIDTSGAYIPGHGTPTVILVGRARAWNEGRGGSIRTVRSVQGEPSAPAIAEEGFVWRAIVDQIDVPDSRSQWVSVGDLDRAQYFAKQPWILNDGGLELNESISNGGAEKLSSRTESIGFCAVTRLDDAYMIGSKPAARLGIESAHIRSFNGGASVRDWGTIESIGTLFPYGDEKRSVQLDPAMFKLLWNFRDLLRSRKALSGTQEEQGLTWYEYSSFNPKRYWSPFLLAFSFVATHNHFTLRRDLSGFIRTAPVIKLREGVTEEEHLQLLGTLNSSTAAFWLRMVSHDKGRPGADTAGADEPWEHRFEFTGTKLEEFPLPLAYPTELAKELDSLAQDLAAVSPAAVVASGALPTAQRMREAEAEYQHIRGRMISLQEELDWHVYFLYGLTDVDLSLTHGTVPEITPSERAFAIRLARGLERGEITTSWFQHHNHKFLPITELPSHWPQPYKDIVNQRIAMTESNSAIGMVERPEYKRRWATDGWDVMHKAALRTWLLDRIETKRELWFDGAGQPTIISLPRLTDRLQEDDGFAAVLSLYAPRADFAKTVAELVGDQHVPAAAALRYKPAGLKKRADWERTWERQREEDAATSEEEKRKIREATAVPPKYTSADFLRTSFWAQRGKLDVPKERFISYGAQNLQTPALLGWAGWDHLQQAQAVVGHLNENQLTQDELVPYLATLLELQPWLEQWHGEYLPDFGQSAAQAYHDFRLTLQGELGLTDEDIRAWRPVAAARGGRAKKTK
ncbi:BREX-2 system adenine-specific DNA-methyltransferase PglX [Actinacidiphila alni]|uniref:BREX-2 system adenine-specific DNA-methyltransferase PglX n=1 Tax=Actinacidiphila alni TaxID=380248 RepID=UPI0033EE8BE3